MYICGIKFQLPNFQEYAHNEMKVKNKYKNRAFLTKWYINIYYAKDINYVTKIKPSRKYYFILSNRDTYFVQIHITF